MIVIEDNSPAALGLLGELAAPQEKFFDGELRSISRVRDGRVTATVVLARRRTLPHGATIELAAAAKPMAVTRAFLLAAMDEACAGVTRVEAFTSDTNRSAIRLLSWLGFQREGDLQRAWNGLAPAILWSITPEQWLTRAECLRSRLLRCAHGNRLSV